MAAVAVAAVRRTVVAVAAVLAWLGREAMQR
jgi:hypothetical protein